MDIKFRYEPGDIENNEVTCDIYMTHKEWLDNEYNQWVEALNSCTVHNFKEHPMVKRMLGEPDSLLWIKANEGIKYDLSLVGCIDTIGRRDDGCISTLAQRYVYYANEILKRNPSSICEIGGGVGQFYAILRALGWQGKYCIIDIPEVRNFQDLYLKEVEKITGLNTGFTIQESYEMVVSFYALGEFTDERKRFYKEEVIDKTPHGYIAWNPHSGASDDLSIFSKHNISVTPGIEEGIKIIQW